jgi:hypothetical protein
MGERQHRDDGGAHRRQVISYLTLRRAIGIMGILFPVLLATLCLWLGECTALEDSISDYYATDVRDVFVGVLFAIAWFLFSYKGYSKTDDVVGNLACVFALGVALFPTNSDSAAIRILHIVCATALFLALAWFSLVLFRKKGEAPTDQKLRRNHVYAICGAVMLGCIALIAIYTGFLSHTAVAKLKPVFWLETLALWAFGFSWLTKGEVLWRDRED